YGFVRAPRDQISAIEGAERRGEVLRRLARELEELPTGLCIPDLDRKQLTVPAGGGDPFAIGVPGHAENNLAVTAELAAHLSGSPIPYFRAHAEAGRNNPLAVGVGADRHAPNFIAMLLEGKAFLTLVALEWDRVPDSDSLVQAGRGEPPSVRAECHGLALVRVSAKAEHLPAGRRVPDAHGLVFAGRGKAPAVQAEGDAQNESVVPQEAADELAGRR